MSISAYEFVFGVPDSLGYRTDSGMLWNFTEHTFYPTFASFKTAVTLILRDWAWDNEHGITSLSSDWAKPEDGSKEEEHLIRFPLPNDATLTQWYSAYLNIIPQDARVYVTDVLCHSCREYFDSNDKVPLGDRVYCTHCGSSLADEYATCISCEKLFHHDDLNAVDDAVYCTSCYKAAAIAYMKEDLDNALAVQEEQILDRLCPSTDIVDEVFGEDDPVDKYMREHSLTADDIDLDYYRDKQHDMVYRLEELQGELQEDQS